MADARIVEVRGRRVWDSRGRPTVEAEVRCAGGGRGRGIAPAGASRGSGEAMELRDSSARLGGWDVRGAVRNVNELIGPALVGLDAADQRGIDARIAEIDGSAHWSRLGGNAVTAASIAVAAAAADDARLPLWRHIAGVGNAPAAPLIPLPEIQIFGGGAHAGRRIDVQDLLVVCPGADSFAEALEWTASVYQTAGRLLDDWRLRFGVTDCGGWWPAFDTNEEALEALTASIESAGFTPRSQVAIALDVAASELWDPAARRYRFALEGRELDRDDLLEVLVGWVDQYPIVTIEDPLQQDDPEGWTLFTAAVGDRVQVAGDDFLVTNRARIERAAAAQAATAALISVNQCGTLTQTKSAFDAATEAGWATLMSARSGDSEDVSITHLAVAWSAGQLKVGALARGERTAKWNEALRIAEESGARFAGGAALKRGLRTPQPG